QLTEALRPAPQRVRDEQGVDLGLADGALLALAEHVVAGQVPGRGREHPCEQERAQPERGRHPPAERERHDLHPSYAVPLTLYPRPRTVSTDSGASGSRSTLRRSRRMWTSSRRVSPK